MHNCIRLTTCKLSILFNLKIIFLLIYFLNLVQLDVNAGFFSQNVNNEELYNLLGVSKTATTKQIRVAFKKLALEKHPDKNQGDPKANELFIKINRAYEILKDDELRKKYDMFGEEGLKDNQNSGQNYQSWNFYHQNFGIYDDDPEVSTLSRSDFKQTVENSQTIWFINFYSTQCSHCHELAPTWRDLAKQLDGVIKIGAVNCMDDWVLCNEQQIRSFPSLIMFPKREKFNDIKNIDNLLKFALSFASGDTYDLSSSNKYENIKNSKHLDKPWLISFCLSSSNLEDNEEEINYELNCLDEFLLRKLAIILNGLVNVGNINCNNNDAQEKLCSKLRPKLSAPIVYYKGLPSLESDSVDEQLITYIKSGDYKKIAEQILSFLPDVRQLNDSEFQTILANLRSVHTNEKPWLIQFVNDHKENQDLELRKLPNLLSTNYNFARIDCSKITDPNLCFKFQLAKFPTFILFKSASSILNDVVNMEEDNWYEIHYGNRQSPDDLANFIRDNAHTPVRTLNNLDNNFIINQINLHQKLGFFIDFFAPWCPPCMNLLPEFRKSSTLEGSKSILYGTIDCSININICQQFNIRSYPTTVLFNNSIPHNYNGQHSAQDLTDFIQDILNPSVIILDYNSFHELVAKKPVGKIWLVDFYASWCGPCQQLAPEWRKLAKRVDSNVVSVGQVDCVVEQVLCSQQGVHSYPNIRIYPTDIQGSYKFDQYQGWMRDVNSLHQWVIHYMPSVTKMLDMTSFERLVLRNVKNSDVEDQQPWLVDFYAPWCGHCQVFAPVFESLANKFEGIVKFGKVNCPENQYLCQMANIYQFPTIRFYPFATSNNPNWQSGDEIQAYDFDSLVNLINNKLKSHGYNQRKKSKSSNDHTEL